MTKQQMQQQIEARAEAARAAGQSIEINRSLPTVCIQCDADNEYFFQEWEATELLDDADKAAVQFNVSVEDVLLAAAVRAWLQKQRDFEVKRILKRNIP